MVNKVQAKPSEEKLATVNADRNLFARLLIASKSRDINLRDLLMYELSLTKKHKKLSAKHARRMCPGSSQVATH